MGVVGCPEPCVPEWCWPFPPASWENLRAYKRRGIFCLQLFSRRPNLSGLRALEFPASIYCRAVHLQLLSHCLPCPVHPEAPKGEGLTGAGSGSARAGWAVMLLDHRQDAAKPQKSWG